MKEFYRLGYRQTQGFIKSVLIMSGYEDLSVPNYTTLSRRCEKLSLKIKSKTRSKISKISRGKSSMVVAVDSTGLSLYDYSDWHYLKHKQQKTKNIDRWRKLHIAIDVHSGEILSAIPSNSKAYDGRYLAPLLDDIDEGIEALVKIYDILCVDRNKGDGIVYFIIIFLNFPIWFIMYKA
jgi:hypothetical protein